MTADGTGSRGAGARPGRVRSTAAVAARFLLTGAQLALASFLTGLQSLALFGAVSGYAPGVVSAYGTAVVISSATVMLGAGATVMVLQRLAGQREERAAEESLSGISATVGLATLLLVPLFALVGGILFLIDGSGLSAVAYGTRVPGMLLAPLLALLAGLLILEGKQRIQLRVAVEHLLIVLAAVVLLPRLDLSATAMLATIGLLGSALDLSALIRFWNRLGEGRPRLRRAARAGLRTLRTSPRPTFRQLPLLASGTMDGMVMMSAYVVITLAASHVGPVEGAATATLVTLARTLVIPMKQFGIAGGRLARTAPRQADVDRRVRLYAGCVMGLLAPLGLTLLLFPGVVGALAGDALTQPHVEPATRLLGAQLLLEGVAGFGSSILKVLVSPAASLPHLALVTYGFTVPAIVVPAVTGGLTVPLLWGAVLAGRIVFGCAVLRIYLRWRTGARPSAA